MQPVDRWRRPIWGLTTSGRPRESGNAGDSPSVRSAPAGAWGSLIHFGVFDPASDGNFLVFGVLGTPQSATSGARSVSHRTYS